MSDRVDEWIAAGLYAPDAADADARLALLVWIDQHGATTAQMQAAHADGHLVSLVGDLALRPGRMTLREVAAATGLSEEEVAQLRRSSGLPPGEPDEPVFSRIDVAMFQAFAAAGQLFSTDELLHFTRVASAAVRRIADAASEMFLRDIEARVKLESRESSVELAQASLDAIQLVGGVTMVFDPLFRAHLETSLRTVRRARGTANDFSSTPLAVAFVDLNGFTERSGKLSAKELLELVTLLEATAIELVGEQGGRLIKLIGDEVMFTTVEPGKACAISVRLIDVASSWGIGARAGIAHGPVITSGGDVYGPVVNLASRMTDIAVAGEVLVNAEVVEQTDDFQFEPAGRRQLKGFAEPIRLWSASTFSS